ncbi:RDD domain containing protein [Elusimicrobium minutum Pei191]|uniref:RDD domain containing protein n=1 Tax=Elusimicrobium minutum (strain Pei191) TaxID=445932 RepID=B2KBD4_ELUMP|nr:RDD family protein [Elusimicrobium minutum]ACC97956.1 RDD domain containing protein [Elusimicrobium minutum Pei191]
MQDFNPVAGNSNKDTVYTIAPVSDRLLAFLVDFLPFYIAPQFLFWYLLNFTSWYNINISFYVYIGLAFYGAFVLYTTIFNSGGRATLGKWLLGLKVISSDEENNLNIVKSFLRSLGYFLSFFTFFLGFAMAFITKRKRALHDFIGGSIVVSTREKSDAETFVISFISAILIGALSAGTYFYVFKATPAGQKELVLNAQTQIAKVAYLQEVHFREYGRYTDDIVRLGLISGDPVQFRRDMQRNLRRRGFRIGVSKDKKTSYKITAVAKDNRNTKVTFDK